MSSSMPEGAAKDAQSVTEVFQPLTTAPIEGVIVKDIQHIITRNSVTTEVIRADWDYEHKNPDEWRLPLDTDQIPYRF